MVRVDCLRGAFLSSLSSGQSVAKTGRSAGTPGDSRGNRWLRCWGWVGRARPPRGLLIVKGTPRLAWRVSDFIRLLRHSASWRKVSMPISAHGTSRVPNRKPTMRAGYGARPGDLNCRIAWAYVQNCYWDPRGCAGSDLSAALSRGSHCSRWLLSGGGCQAAR